jgi:hypothetical protein
LLAEEGLNKQAPTIIATAADKKNRSGMIGHLVETQPLLLSALFYNLTDATWFVSGIQRARHNRPPKFTKADWAEMTVGIAYCIGDVLLAFYGKDKSKHPMLEFSDALAAHLKQDGIVLPGPDATPEAIAKSGFFPSANRFLEKNIVPVKALSKFTGGTLTTIAALKPGNFNFGKLMNGLLVSSGWLATLALDKPQPLPYTFKADEKAQKDSGDDGLLHWFTENPRKRITAPLTMLGTPFKLGGSWNEARNYKRQVIEAQNTIAGKTGSALKLAQEELQHATRKQYDWSWNVVGTCSMLIGNYLFGLSGNRKAHDIKSMDDFQKEALVAAANMLSAIPGKARGVAVEDAADYIAGIKGIKQGKEEVAKAISAQIDQLKTNAFAVHQR